MDEKDIFVRHIGILSEDFQHNLGIVAEGQQMLSKKLDRVEGRLEQRIDRVEQRIHEVDAKLSKKIGAVAADLTAHRADTESHRTGYQVSESKD